MCKQAAKATARLWEQGRPLSVLQYHKSWLVGLEFNPCPAEEANWSGSALFAIKYVNL